MLLNYHLQNPVAKTKQETQAEPFVATAFSSKQIAYHKMPSLLLHRAILCTQHQMVGQGRWLDEKKVFFRNVPFFYRYTSAAENIAAGMGF